MRLAYYLNMKRSCIETVRHTASVLHALPKRRRYWKLALAVALAGWAALTLNAEVRAQQAPAAADADSAAYTVVPGDTLYEIAVRFGVTLEDLIAVNGIVNENLIEPGQVLVIPSGSPEVAALPAPTSLVRALPGETLTVLAQRIGQEPAAIAALNQLPEDSPLFPGQPIEIPVADTPPEPAGFGAVVDMRFPGVLVQGRTGNVVVKTRSPLELRADWNGLPIAFTPHADDPLRQFAYLPVPALLAPATYTLTISYTSSGAAASDVPLSRSWPVAVSEGEYGRTEINLPPDRSNLLDPEIVQRELELVTGTWSQQSPELLWSDVFSRPIDTEYPTTSPFGVRRSYNGGPYASYHAGQDFGAPVGITVTAPADGIVALTEPLSVRGNAILLDHGRGVFTGYWHLDESFVQTGQNITRGEPIGLVGNTGLSTGAHLHWELRIYGIAVDPMQFLEEPLRPY